MSDSFIGLFNFGYKPMGLCFGKPCADASADGHSSPVHRALASNRHSLPPSQGRQLSARITAPAQTFQEILAQKAEEAFDPRPSSFYNIQELPSTNSKVRPGRLGIKEYQIKHAAHATGAPFRVHLRTSEEFPVFQTAGSSPAEHTITDSGGENAESFSSYRGGSMRAVSIFEDIAGNTTPVLKFRGKSKEFDSKAGSSPEIIRETESDSSVSNKEHYMNKCFVSVADDEVKEKVIMVDSRSSSQDVLSLEFLEEFCRISEVTSQSSFCSEIDVKQLDSNAALQNCAPAVAVKASTEGENSVTEMNFMDFLCSQSQIAARIAQSRMKMDNSSAGTATKKRSSTSWESLMPEPTKRPRFSPDERAGTSHITDVCSTSSRRISFTIAGDDGTYLKVLPIDDYLQVVDSKRRHRNISVDRTPPSTPGSFRSTPFASVGSSFSMEDLNVRRSPCTPLSASFTSAGSLTMEEMTAIWNTFQEGQPVQ